MVGKNGIFSRPSLSASLKPCKLRIATLPASDSETPFISLKGCEPVNQYCPMVSERSTRILMKGKSSGAYWISSINSGAGYVSRKSSGSRRAKDLTIGSSRVTSRRSGSAIDRKSVVLPTCLGPESKTHLKDLEALRTTGDSVRSMIFILQSYHGSGAFANPKRHFRFAESTMDDAGAPDDHIGNASTSRDMKSRGTCASTMRQTPPTVRSASISRQE